MKNIMKRLITDEKGQAMLLAVILLLVGGLIVASLLSFMGTGLLVNPVYEGRVAELYGADAGVEDAVWKIQNQDGYLPCNPSSPPRIYNITVNDKNVAVNITSEFSVNNLTFIYRVVATATGDGSGTQVEAYVDATIVSGDYSGILDNILTSQNGIELSPNVEVNPEEGEHAPVDYYGGAWPTPGVLSNWYWQDVEDETHYYSDTEIDLEGQDLNLGPLYIDGELTIENSINTPATLTLDGTLYITGDTMITPNQDLTLELNGHTIYVASNSSDPQRALWIGGKCTINGPGVIIAVGDIYFEPKGDVGSDEGPIFVFSVSGETQTQPQGDFYGCIAGSVMLDIQPGTTMNYPEDEGWYEGLNFPIGGTQYLVYSIASWQVTPLSPQDFAE
jgi:hypothetical protein